MDYKTRKSLRDLEAGMVQVEILPDGDMGQMVNVTGYGAAPRTIEVFSPDEDDLMEASDLQQIEINIENETKQQVLNMDLSTEYQRPNLQRALKYRRLHMPMRSDGTNWPYWSTRTGRFCPKRLRCLDCFREGNKSEFVSYGPGVSAYFKFLKSVTWLFFYLCITSLPFLIINVNAGTFYSKHAIPFAQTTLGNLYIAVNQTSGNSTSDLTVLTLRLSICGVNGCRVPKQTLLAGYAVWDAFISLSIVLAVQYIYFYSIHEKIVYQQKIPKIEDYSIETTVPDGAGADEIEAHFKNMLQSILATRDQAIVDNETRDAEQEQAKKAKAFAKAAAKGNDIASISTGDALGETDVIKKTAAELVEEVRLEKIEAARRELFTEIYDVQIVESTGNAIALCVKRGILLKKLARLDARVKVMTARNIHVSRIEYYRNQFHKTRERIKELDEQAVLRAEQGHVLKAFVTFDTQEARLQILNGYDVFRACGTQPAHLKLNNQIVIIKPAPPPSNLLWENQEFSWRRRLPRIILSILLLLALLGCTAGISFISNSNRALNDVLDTASSNDLVALCGGLYDNIASILGKASSARADNNYVCFCDFFLFAPASNVTQGSNVLFLPGGYCAGRAFERLALFSREIGLAFVVIVINLIVHRLVVVLGDFLRFPNIVVREFFVLRSIFLITFVDSAIVLLLVNINWTLMTGTTIRNSETNTYILTGRFVDFEPVWYNRAGLEIFFIAVLNIFGPHIFPLVRYLYHVLERRFYSPYVVSQQVLNEMYIGEEFMLSVRLAQTLMMIFFTLTFSTGLPILYFTGLVSVIVSYWLDKFYFVRLVRMPPQFDTQLQLWTVRTVEWGVILHCLMGFWMYSSPRTFPLTRGEAANSALSGLASQLQVDGSFSNTTTFNFWAELTPRFFRTEAIIMLGTAIFVFLMKVVRRFGRTVISQCSKRAHFLANCYRALVGKSNLLMNLNAYVRNAVPFDEAMHLKIVAGVRSYNILANPVYQRVFQMQDGKDRVETDLNRENSSASLVPEGSTPEEAAGARKMRSVQSQKGGFKSLQDALNIKKGSAVSSIEARSIWRDDVSATSGKSNATTQLFGAPTKASVDDDDDEESAAGVRRSEVKSTSSNKSTKTKGAAAADDDAKSTVSSKSTKSMKLTKSKAVAGAAAEASNDDVKSTVSTTSTKLQIEAEAAPDIVPGIKNGD